MQTDDSRVIGRSAWRHGCQWPPYNGNDRQRNDQPLRPHQTQFSLHDSFVSFDRIRLKVAVLVCIYYARSGTVVPRRRRFHPSAGQGIRRNRLPSVSRLPLAGRRKTPSLVILCFFSSCRRPHGTLWRSISDFDLRWMKSTENAYLQTVVARSLSFICAYEITLTLASTIRHSLKLTF